MKIYVGSPGRHLDPEFVEELYIFLQYAKSSGGTTSTWLRTKLDAYKDPCKDFYGYVCGTHRGPNQLTQIAATLRQQNMQFLKEVRVPRRYQRSWEKAAGLFQNCMSLVESNRSELDFSREEKEWLGNRLRYPESVNTNDYAELLKLYGVQPSRDTELAANLVAYEKELEYIIEKHPEKEPKFVSIDSIAGKFTKPYNARDQWVKAFSKYTNNTYTAVDPVLSQEAAVDVLVAMIKSVTLGEEGLRYLIAWSVYTQLVKYTAPHLLLDTKTAADACYAHADKAMHLALTSPFLQKVVPSVLQAVKTMVSGIRNGFREILESSWVTGNDRSVVLRKLENMKTYVGSPGRRLDPNFVEGLYQSYPDVPPDRLFPSWIEALSLSSHYLWSDQKTWLYDETEIKAQYEIQLNTLVVPTAAISRPLYTQRVPEALNYGALGAIVGHEMMHAYDVTGIDYDENAKHWNWRSAAFTREYTKRALCLRRSHRSAARFIRKRVLLDDDSFYKEREPDDCRVCFFCLLLVIPVILCTIFVTLYINYSRLTDEGDVTLPDGLPELHIATPPVPDQRQPPRVLVPGAKPLAPYTPVKPKRDVPSRVQNPHVCATPLCRFVVQWLRSKLNTWVHPCDDFYYYVCTTFRGTTTPQASQDDIESATIRYIKDTKIPKTKQTFYQKAAGVFQACLNFLKKNVSEVALRARIQTAAP
ncbi:hypothetical protein HPB52_020283 [Rhipicephalus sanguineus]|uniref:M13 family peptidase n=1 Tax=Rhipicephalus sanguineus TaxID=34632 RepID=A0A9D4PXP2_RHISA|nr:hypothetical protein HPB52_020283 [Rhipicephalus sanguineus]